jgi:hypothetical protein
LFTPRRSLAITSAVALAFAAGAVVALCRDNEAQPPVPTAPLPAGAAGAPALLAAPEVAEALRAAAEDPQRASGIGHRDAPPEGAAVFPDGTWLEPLNGVERAPPFPSEQLDFDLGPVVLVYTNPDTRVQWFIHTGGAVSTTWPMEHRAGDRTWREPGWIVGRPAPSLPVR